MSLWHRLAGPPPYYYTEFMPEPPHDPWRPCFGCGQASDDNMRCTRLCGKDAMECHCEVTSHIRAAWLNVAFYRARPIREWIPGEERPEPWE